MVGFSSSDQYDNDTLESWMMSLGQRQGERICGANIEYDSSTSKVVLNNVLGGISPIGSHTATGLLDLQYEVDFKTDICVFAMATSVDDQAWIYYSDKSGCKVMTLTFDGSFDLSDEPCFIYAGGR